MFLWMTNAMQFVKISLCITKDVKIQDGRQLWLKNRFSVWGKQQDTQIMKFNSHPYTLSLQYPYITLIPARISNYIRHKVCDEITYLSPSP